MIGPQFTIQTEEQFERLLEFAFDEDSMTLHNGSEAARIVTTIPLSRRAELFDEYVETLNTDTEVGGSDE